MHSIMIFGYEIATKFQYISHRISSGSDSEVVLKVHHISEILWAKKGLLSIVLHV